MSKETRKVKILKIEPTCFKLKFLDTEGTSKVAKQFFKRRVDAGVFKVMNPEKLPDFI